MGIFTFDEGSGNFSVFNSDTGSEVFFPAPVIVRETATVPDTITAIPDTQATNYAEILGISPEVAAGLNQETLARIAGDQQTAEQFLNIRETRIDQELLFQSNAFDLGITPDVAAGLNSEALARVAANDQKAAEFITLQATRPTISENRILFGELLDADVIAGLNPAAINRVASNQETADRFIELTESREINKPDSFLDKIINPITANVAETQATVKRAVTIFLILLVIVVVVVLASLFV